MQGEPLACEDRPHPPPACAEGCRASSRGRAKAAEWRATVPQSEGRVPPAPPGPAVQLMPLSLPAGTGKSPYQFTTLRQATAQLSKPLDGSGLFKNDPGTCPLSVHPLCSPTAGQVAHLAWGNSLPLLGVLVALFRAPWKRDAHPHPPHPAPSVCTSACCTRLGHPPHRTRPPLSHGWHRVLALDLRAGVCILLSQAPLRTPASLFPGMPLH